MEFGLNFFPSCGPAEKTAERYFAEILHLAEVADRLGFHHVRTVEHYFESYGGYSPNPIVFLAAAAMRTKRLRLVTGAILPIFNNPLKVAGEIGMLDAISGGRLDVGFARAFLPHEFARFGRSLDESRARFEEGVRQIHRLLAEENVTERGQFHSFEDVTSLPRPTQTPTPPIWVAALSTPASFAWAGAHGYNIMAIAIGGAHMKEMLDTYREARRAAGHPGRGEVMLSFSMHAQPTREQAIANFRGPLNAYLKALVDGASGWLTGASTKDYPGYDKTIAKLKEDSFDGQLERRIAWCGTPDEIADMIADYDRAVGGFEIASLLTTPHTIAVDKVESSLRLFADRVMPRFTSVAKAA
jgi:alkanesulfonate monooxygenase SsuD/methylene tetrahydromethanopterin reductase-like flavin-dependent oxidoreductase (luciferase family)